MYVWKVLSSENMEVCIESIFFVKLASKPVLDIES